MPPCSHLEGIFPSWGSLHVPCQALLLCPGIAPLPQARTRSGSRSSSVTTAALS